MDTAPTAAPPPSPQRSFVYEARRPEPKAQYTPPPRSQLLDEIEHGEKKGRGFPTSKGRRLYKVKIPDTEPREWDIPPYRRFLRPILFSQLLILLVVGAFFLVRNVILPNLSQHGSETHASTPPTSIVTSALTYTLSYKPEPTGGGRISMSPEKETYTSGAQVTLTATPTSGYTFDHWSGDVSGSSPTIPIIINSNVSVVAYFKVKDTTPPVISNIEVTKYSDIGATITWKTDEPATSQVEYGITNAYGSNTPPNENMTSSHSVTLAGLKSDTTYYFRVKSKDASGNEATPYTDKFSTLAAVNIGHEIGNRAPDFTLPRWKDPNPRDPQTPNKGGEVALSNLRGKKVLLNLWSTYCGPCVRELPLIREIYEGHGKNSGDLAVITICLDREETNRIKELEEKYSQEGLICTFPILLDLNNETKDSYDIGQYPTTFLINSGGIIEKFKNECFQDKAEIEAFIKSP